MTRAEYVAPAQRRRAEAQEMRATGISVREIARVLAVSVREVYRLLGSVVIGLIRTADASSSAVVQGSPALSDFKAASSPGEALVVVAVSSDCDESKNGGVNSQPFTAHGGAIAAAIVSEYAVRAHSAQPESDVTYDGRGVLGETVVAESPIEYIQRRVREIVAKMRDLERPP